jgi:hypothetical protein
VVFIGVLLVYGDDIRKLAGGFESQVDRWANPEQFHESGTPKSEQQLFEESVVCAYSGTHSVVHVMRRAAIASLSNFHVVANWRNGARSSGSSFAES